MVLVLDDVPPLKSFLQVRFCGLLASSSSLNGLRPGVATSQLSMIGSDPQPQLIVIFALGSRCYMISMPLARKVRLHSEQWET